MANVIDYLCTEFDSFEERPLGDIDSLILTWLSYYLISDDATLARTAFGVPYVDLYRSKSILGATAVVVDESDSRCFLAALASNPRFDGLHVANYVDEIDEEREKQFSAMTFMFPCGITYVAFRGTDNSLVGWKEDFNLAYGRELPSQRAATEYLERVAGLVGGPLYVGGHSKGGNLAFYAALACSDAVADRLVAAFSHDGPGFSHETATSSAWESRAHLMRKTVPNQSVIGMIFDDPDDVMVIASTETGIMQHNPLSWVVEGTEFKQVDKLDRSARHVDRSINAWVASMTQEQRETFVETLFDVFGAGGEKTFAELGDNWKVTVPAMLEYIHGMSGEQRSSFADSVSALARNLVPDFSLKNFATAVEESIEQKLPR